jgi:23S rRNA pseudouridine1911/1915/1917 synthase
MTMTANETAQARPAPINAAVPAEHAGTRADRFLATLDGAPSRSRIKALIEQGYIEIDGATINDPAYRVKAGQHVRLSHPDPAPETAEAETIPLTVAYEDEAVIVVDKPAGLVVHPAAGTPEGTLVNALIARCGGAYIGSGPERRGGVVHRLDKDTSGLMVVAKTPEAADALVAQFQAREVGRRYIGVVWGCPSPTRGTLRGAIGRSPVNRKKMAVVDAGGRDAITHYAVREALCDAAAARLDFKLETGRTHQIRVHMTHQGHALVGDPVYGGAGGKTRRRLPPEARAAADAFPRQALHAADLAFTHPETGARLSFTSPLPAEMQRLIQALGGELEKHDAMSHI